jgi:PUB domain
MELRNTETIINDVALTYKTLQLGGDSKWQQELPSLSTVLFDNNNNNNNNEENKDNPVVSNQTMTATLALELLQSMKDQLNNIRPVLEKFQKRIKEKDPITDQPRYGVQTAGRVQLLLDRYTELVLKIVQETFGNDDDENYDDDINSQNKTRSNTVLATIRDMAAQEIAEQQQLRQDELNRQRTAIAQRLAEEQQLIDEQRRQEQELVLAREEAERQARMIREANLQAQRDIVRRDQEWVASIPNRKTIQGVKEQLMILYEATANDKIVQSTALKALQTIFSQIVSHPEEDNFRRIRRDHPKFVNDIGRHVGGKELLIASGFDIGTIDDVPSYICHEPNIENDMDGWSTWFDLLKNTLQAIEEQIMKK